MRISTLTQNTQVRQTVTRLQAEMAQAQNQLATSKRAETHGGLGRTASQSLSLRADLNRIEQNTKTIAIAQTRMEVMQTTFDRTRENAENLSLDALTGAHQNDVRLPTLQVTADAMLGETLGMMNRTVGGRYIFGGSRTDVPPAVDMDTVLHGDPKTGRFGLVQQIADRARADQVDDATAPGGLATAVDTTAGTVTLTDVRRDGFGFTIEQVTSSAGIDVTTGQSATDTSVTLDNLGALDADDTVTVVVGLPDGETAEITVTADGPLAGRAQNLHAAIDRELAALAGTDLAAASALRASADFFETTPPKVVRFQADGAPVLEEDDAASPRAVWWYAGSTGDDPRGEVAAELDEGTTIRYGVRADEPALSRTLSRVAVFSAVPFDDAETDMYRALADKAGRGLQEAMGDTERLINEIGAIQEVTETVDDRNQTVKLLAETQLGDIEGIDPYEVTTRLLAFETQLQASYQVTSRLSGLSLVNVLRF